MKAQQWLAESLDAVRGAVASQKQHLALEQTYARLLSESTVEEAQERLSFFQGYLRPHGLFPRTLIQSIYSVPDEEGRIELIKLTDAFFLEVPVVCALDALTSYLLTADGSLARAHVWRLLGCLVGRDSEIESMWRIEDWRELSPELSWETCCERIVGWCITLIEVAQKDDQPEFLSDSFLPRVAGPLVKSFLEGEAEATVKLRLLGSLMKRSLNRGVGGELAQTVIDECQSWLEVHPGTPFLAIVRGIQDPHATEKFFQELLQMLSQITSRDRASALLNAFCLTGDGEIEGDVGYLLFQRLLLRQKLSRQKASLLVALLVEAKGKLMEISQQLSKTWADANAMDHLPLPQQGYLTYILTELIPHLPGNSAVGDPAVYRALLEGVSNRLGSCLEATRFQGMRVAHAIAARQPRSRPLFSDLEMDFQSIRREEEWEEAPPEPIIDQSLPQTEAAEVDSDDESDFCNSLADDDAPEPEDREALEKAKRPRTLVDLHQDLRKTDEPLKVISALKQLTAVMRLCPYELPSLAADLSRTLIHVPLPDWIHEELKRDDAYALKGLRSSSAVRVCCLKILLTEAPVHCGDSVAKMVCSKQLAEHQRLEILEALREAADCLSAPPESLVFDDESQRQLLDASGKTQVWGARSMELEKQRKQPGWRNRFVEVAGLWISALLLSTQTVTHGFNLMARNPMVLGAVLVTLGTFTDCASQSIVSTSLVLSSYPLLKAVMEQKGENCYLRRCSLQVMASFVNSLPVGRLTAALKLEAPLQIADDADLKLKEFLTWTEGQSGRILESDTDETCRYLAAHCLQSCAQISKSALELGPNESPFTPRAIHYRIPNSRMQLPLQTE